MYCVITSYFVYFIQEVWAATHKYMFCLVSVVCLSALRITCSYVHFFRTD